MEHDDLSTINGDLMDSNTGWWFQPTPLKKIRVRQLGS